MKVGLIDVDGHNFPNLALMKISAWHKANGDTVEWCFPLDVYDRVYKAKVFDDLYSKDDETCLRADEIIKGGTGYFRTKKDENGNPYNEIYHNGKWENIGYLTEATRDGETYKKELPYDVEHIYPDYSLYPELTKNTAYGFLTRGCPRGCGFCIVEGKEGRKSVKVADLSEFWRGQKNIELLDPNIFGCREHIDLLQQLVDSKARVNFNQGLDIRLVSEQNVSLINQMKVNGIHFAWDNADDDLTPYFQKYLSLAKHKPHGRFGDVYCLTNYGSTMEGNLHRIYTLRDLGFDPYVMIYDKPNAPREIRLLQRWCNNKRIFRTCNRFEDYDAKKG